MSRRKQLIEGEFWADKLMDLANLATVVLVFGQFVSPKIDWNVLGIGVIVYMMLVIFSKHLRKE